MRAIAVLRRAAAGPGARPPRPRRRTAPAVLALLAAALLGGCGCPPRVVRYDSPEATLATWQSHLCHGDASAEYACLAARFKRDIGGFQNYHAWRQELLDESPVLSWLIKRADIGEHVVDTWQDERGRDAVLTLGALGQTLRIGFTRETWSRVVFADGRVETARQDDLFERLVTLRETGQWVALQGPDLRPEALEAIRSIHFDTRWVIAAIDAAALPERSVE